MDVRSKKQPFTLSHVYYANGQRYCEVPLKVNYPRTRTWSNVVLNKPEHVGQWRVDVVTENGEILDQIDFSVVL
jgi:hypothetical protein